MNPNAYLGIIALIQGDKRVARESLIRAVQMADALLGICKKGWEAFDAKGLALCGLALIEGESRIDESVAAFTAATSPRTIAVTKPAPIFS